MYGSTQRQLKDFIPSLMPAGLFSRFFLNSTVPPIFYCLIKTVKVIKIKHIQSWIRLNLRHNLIALCSQPMVRGKQNILGVRSKSLFY